MGIFEKQTKKEVGAEMIRFLLVGGLATVLDYLVAYLFYRFLLSPSLVGEGVAIFFSTAFGFIVGLVINWILSVLFVFRHIQDRAAASSKKSFVRFTLIGLCGLAITELGMLLLPFFPVILFFQTELFLGVAWNWWVLKGIMTCIVLVFNYVGRKVLIFKS